MKLWCIAGSVCDRRFYSYPTVDYWLRALILQDGIGEEDASGK
jgi:hypothetical protein